MNTVQIAGKRKKAKSEAELELERKRLAEAAARQKQLDAEAELAELNEIDRHARLDNMTRDQAANFALRAFGVRIDPAHRSRQDVIDEVRNAMRLRGA